MMKLTAQQTRELFTHEQTFTEWLNSVQLDDGYVVDKATWRRWGYTAAKYFKGNVRKSLRKWRHLDAEFVDQPDDAVGVHVLEQDR